LKSYLKSDHFSARRFAPATAWADGGEMGVYVGEGEFAEYFDLADLVHSEATSSWRLQAAHPGW
jgi:hypothetical protein